jgi:hypothetical protein
MKRMKIPGQILTTLFHYPHLVLILRDTTSKYSIMLAVQKAYQ